MRSLQKSKRKASGLKGGPELHGCAFNEVALRLILQERTIPANSLLAEEDRRIDGESALRWNPRSYQAEYRHG
jgi:hypothetical protein